MQTEITARLTRLHQWMMEKQDEKHAKTIHDLIDKLNSGKASIGFCGHFSAGKSSLINALFGREILPSGPIPTSANLVTIESGKQSVSIEHVSDSGGLALTDIPLEQLASYCKDGEQYRQIAIRYPNELLGDRLRLLDTPGVDSTDEAHMAATESALHLADIVFYVADYNYVLSDVNLTFAKRLKDEGKPLYMIINQIDKHEQSELSWDDYRAKVKQSFHDWGIQPDGYLFVSVKHQDLPNNEWNLLLAVIERLKDDAERLLDTSVLQSAFNLISSHVKAVYPEAERSETSEEERLAVQKLDELDERIAERSSEPNRVRESFSRELTSLLNNAQIIPATTRDIADRYLQSRKPGFKVGLLFSKAKTEAEIMARRDALVQCLNADIERQLIWHLNTLIAKYEKTDLASMQLTTERLEVPFAPITGEWIAAQVNEAAGYSESYTMTYCRQIAEHIRSDYRRLTLKTTEPLFARMEAQAAEQASAIVAAREQLLDQTERLRYAIEQQKLKAEYEAELLSVLGSGTRQAHYVGPDPDRLKKELPATLPMNVAPGVRLGEASVQTIAISSTVRTSQSSLDPFQYRTIMEQIAVKLEKVAETMEPATSLTSVRANLLDRARKLRGNRFTVALFGAFSAGKSSLASALIGEAILPVSPNPTTAAINAIVPPDELHPHRTALIRMKSWETMQSDARYAASMLGLAGVELQTIDQINVLLSSVNEDQIPARGKPYLSFLHAMNRGFKEAVSRLGTEWTCDFATYSRYVADEEKSCYVESIDLYYETKYGKQGVIFVDTPGADSIHARHTGVTFNYLKNADAIIYVTYYNHAFSRADRQFLQQLGRVKETFELDKMFFVVNAADLAQHADELRQVTDYVSDQLQKHGIHRPRLFPLSSRLALQGKKTNDQELLGYSGLAVFEDDFAHFAATELAAHMAASAEAELVHAVDRFRDLIGHLQQDDAARAAQAEMMRAKADKLKKEIASAAESGVNSAASQELAELLHHVKQRCYYRFGEWYNDAFHPSVLQDQRDKKQMLQAAWQQLLSAASVEASQELLATTLRMEKFAIRQLQEWASRALDSIKGELPETIVDGREKPAFQSPTVGETLDVSPESGNIVEKYYKNARTFFEGDGKQNLKPHLEKAIGEAIGRFLDGAEPLLARYYEEWLREQLLLEADHLCEQIDQNVQLYARQTEEKQNLQELQDRMKKLETYLFSGTSV